MPDRLIYRIGVEVVPPLFAVGKDIHAGILLGSKRSHHFLVGHSVELCLSDFPGLLLAQGLN